MKPRKFKDTNNPVNNWIQVPRYEQLAIEGQGPEASSSTGHTHSTTELTHVTSETSAQSTYSYDSSRDYARYFKEIDGRRFASTDSTYPLPFDETEFERLDKLHITFTIGLGSLYPCTDVVERILAPAAGVKKRILDLGCGTGIWAVAMAHKFPHASVIGVDLAPTPLTVEQVPPNAQFEIDDINQGLNHFSNQFDVVHMRCVDTGLPNYSQTISSAAGCIKPGGILLLGEIDMNLCAEDMVSSQKMATPDQPDGSWLQRYQYEFRWTNAANGTDIFKAEEMLDQGLWSNTLFEHCGAGSMFTPMGPWPTSSNPEEADRMNFTGILQRQNNKNTNRAFHTVMREHGIPQNMLEDWTERAEQELDTLSIHSWMRFRMLWGIRKGGTPLPEVDPEHRWRPNRHTHVYQTQEEAIAARNKRLGTVGEVVRPYVF